MLYYALNRGAHILEEYRRLNWAPFVFGIVLAGLEAGSLYAYKAGWAVSTLTATKNAFLAALLLLVGFLLYKEPLMANKLVGTVICLVGLYIINK